MANSNSNAGRRVYKLPFDVCDEIVEDPSLSLPPDHFLSQAIPALTSDNIAQQNGGRLDLSTLASADFDIDVASGFLPPSPPLRRFSASTPWHAWEVLWDQSAHLKIASKQSTASDHAQAMAWRKSVDSAPVITDEGLETIALLRRGHVLLSFLAHRYVHLTTSKEGENPTIPPAISVPWLQICSRLDMPPVLTYADTVLWNWDYIDPRRGFVADNLQMVQTFTNTRSEEHFYLTSLLIELQGVPALRLMATSLDEAFVNDSLAHLRIASYLTSLSSVIDQLALTMEEVSTHCTPQSFYHDIRPWFNGGSFLHLPSQTIHTYGGPSAGQSSLVHALDVFLGILHAPQEQETGHDETFMLRMSSYMPHHHRNFLRHLARQEPTVRSLAMSSDVPELVEAYDRSIQSLKKFRDAHMRVVYKFIMQPAREEKMKEATEKGKKEELRGTGGTNLVSFLKSTRDRTREALLG